MHRKCSAAGLRHIARDAAFAVTLTATAAFTLEGCGSVSPTAPAETTSSAAASPSSGATTTATPPAATGTAPLAAVTTIAGSPPTSVQAGQPYYFAPVVTEPSGATLSFSSANRPVWAVFNAATGVLSGMPASTNVGTFANIQITVKAGSATASLPAFSVQVKAAAATEPTLESLTLSPLVLRLTPGGTQPLTVVGTYSVPTSEETFASSNSTVASVSAAGIVTIAAHASVGASASISATYTAGHMTTSPAGAAEVTVVAAATAPTANSAGAAAATAQNNPLCGSPIMPFYWEIGDKSGALASGSQGLDTNGKAILATTTLPVASASKWVYGTYVVQLRGAAANLTAKDIDFLHFTSGYTYMGSDTTSSQCPVSQSPDTVNTCLTLKNTSGVAYDAQNPATVGKFDYDSGHLENHASQLGGIGGILPGGSLIEHAKQTPTSERPLGICWAPMARSPTPNLCWRAASAPRPRITPWFCGTFWTARCTCTTHWGPIRFARAPLRHVMPSRARSGRVGTTPWRIGWRTTPAQTATVHSAARAPSVTIPGLTPASPFMASLRARRRPMGRFRKATPPRNAAGSFAMHG